MLNVLNTIILVFEVFLCVGGFMGLQITFGHGLGDIIYYAVLYLLTIVHLIWTIKIGKETNRSAFFYPLTIFSITTILFYLKATIWRGPEYSWRNGNLFYLNSNKDAYAGMLMDKVAIDNPNFNPDSKTETLTLIYNAISCPCAQWSETRFSKDPDRKVNYWLEPANPKLINADTLYNGENLPVIIKVTGQVVSEKGFPKGEELSKVGLDEAGKVFRYIKIEVIQIGSKKNGR